MSNLQQEINNTQAALDSGALTEGAAAVVPKGDEIVPIKVDPAAARKAMFKKADALRGLDSAAGSSDVDPQIIARLQAEARGEEYVPEGGARPAAENRHTPPTGQRTNEYVTIPVEGGEIRVSKTDIDREGSVESYLRRREVDEAMAQDKIAIANLQRELAESNRLREQLQSRTAGQDDPANRSAAPADRNLTGSGASENELAGLAERLAKQIYSGDENDARAAILEILQRDRSNTLSATEIERQVREAVTRSATNPTPATTTVVPVNPRLQAINAQIDAMAIKEYPEVCQNDIARNATFAYFKELVNLPENRDRRAVDVARDACDWGRSKFFGDPRSKIVEQKRGLPSSVTASGASTATTEETTMTPSQVVEMMQQHRNYGRRITPQ
jgi:hypothetical protein